MIISARTGMLVCVRENLNYPGLPSGVLGCPRISVGDGEGWGLELELGIGVWGRPRTVVGNPR